MKLGGIPPPANGKPRAFTGLPRRNEKAGLPSTQASNLGGRLDWLRVALCPLSKELCVQMLRLPQVILGLFQPCVCVWVCEGKKKEGKAREAILRSHIEPLGRGKNL